jgi:hypothetical protein
MVVGATSDALVKQIDATWSATPRMARLSGSTPRPTIDVLLGPDLVACLPRAPTAADVCVWPVRGPRVLGPRLGLRLLDDGVQGALVDHVLVVRVARPSIPAWARVMVVVVARGGLIVERGVDRRVRVERVGILVLLVIEVLLLVGMALVEVV